MPFTLSHALAVLPGLRQDGVGSVRGRGPLVAAALVAGSFAPDVPYFADALARGLFGLGQFTHAPLGVALVDPVIAAALVGGWVMLRGPLVALLPERRQAGVAALAGVGDRMRPSARSVAAFWASAVAGATTHVVWDAFTHPGRWGVRLLPFLEHEVHGTALHKYVQYGSSAVALALLGWYGQRALRSVPDPAGRDPLPVPRLSGPARRLAPALLGATTAGAAVVRAERWYRETGDAPGMIPAGLFGAGAGLAVAAAAWAGAVHLTHRAVRRDARATRRQWAADSQSAPTPTETSSGARNG